MCKNAHHFSPLYSTTTTSKKSIAKYVMPILADRAASTLFFVAGTTIICDSIFSHELQVIKGNDIFISLY
jgi:hypothetical protein